MSGISPSTAETSAEPRFHTSVTTKTRQPLAMQAPTRTPFCLGAAFTPQAVRRAHSAT